MSSIRHTESARIVLVKVAARWHEKLRNEASEKARQTDEGVKAIPSLIHEPINPAGTHLEIVRITSPSGAVSGGGSKM